MINREKYDNKKIIFILFSDLGIGGVQRKIADIVKFLNLRKNTETQITILLNRKKSYDLTEDIFLEKIKKSGATVFYKPDLSYRRFELPYTLFVIWKVYILKPKTILSFMESYGFTAVLMKLLFFWRKIRIIISFDNVASVYLRSFYPKKRELKKWEWYIRIFFKHADKLVVPSEESKKDMIKSFYIPPKIIVVNRNWVTMFSKVNSSKKKYDIIYTGRIDPTKNLKLFVNVVKKVTSRFNKVSAVIVGWGKDMAKISRYIHTLSLQNKIVLIGSQKDVFKLLNSSKVFLLTSKFEGLPISVLEAMACGLPVVVKNYPGADEVVINGKTGFIANNKKELSEKLIEILNSDKKRHIIGREARRYVNTYHSRRNLKKFVNLII